MSGMTPIARTRRRRGDGELWPDNRDATVAYSFIRDTDGTRTVTVSLPADAAGEHPAGAIMFDSDSRVPRTGVPSIFATQRRADRIRDHLAWLLDVCSRFDVIPNTTYEASVRGGVRLESAWEEAA